MQREAAEPNFLLKARLLHKEVFEKLMFPLLKWKTLRKKLPDGANKNLKPKIVDALLGRLWRKKSSKAFFVLFFASLLLLLRMFKL